MNTQSEFSSSKPFAGLNCLVLEDEFLIALDIERILESAGAKSVTCKSRIPATLAALEELGPFDLAVIDLTLDGQPSKPVALELQARGIPFVIVTGKSSNPAPSPDAPEAPIVAKPFEAATLVAALQNARAREPVARSNSKR